MIGRRSRTAILGCLGLLLSAAALGVARPAAAQIEPPIGVVPPTVQGARTLLPGLVAIQGAVVLNVTWPVAFADTAYTVTCTPKVSNPYRYVAVDHVITVTPSLVQVVVVDTSGSWQGAYVSNLALHCIAVHD